MYELPLTKNLPGLNKLVFVVPYSNSLEYSTISNYLFLEKMREIHFVYIYSKVRDALEIFGSWSNEVISRMQSMQNKVFKLVLNFDRYATT